MKIEEISCPNCAMAGTCEKVPHLSHVNILALLAGGIIFSFLWSASRPTKLKCTACEHRFSKRTQGAKTARVIFWILIVLVGFGLLTIMDVEA